MGSTRKTELPESVTRKRSAPSRRTHTGGSDRAPGAMSHLQAIIDNLDDELMVVDRDLRVTLANRSVRRRYPGGNDVIGRHCYEVTHGRREPCTPPHCECPVRKVLASGKPERVTHIHVTGSGDAFEERYSEIIATPLRDDDGDISEVVELMRDTTETRMLEERIVEANRSLRILNAIATALNESVDLDTLLDSTLSNVMKLLRVKMGAIMLLDRESQKLSHYVHRGLSDEFVKGIGDLSLGEGIVGKIALLRKPVVLEDITRSPDVANPELVAREGHRGFCGVPLYTKEGVLGVLNVGTRTPRQFTAGEVRLLTGIANQVAIAVENRMLYRDILRKEEMRGELLRQLITAQEDERKRIARELHDEISQSLTGLAVSLEAVVESPPLTTEDLQKRLRRVQSIALGTLDGIHNAIYELRPSLLDDFGLAAAVEWHIENSLTKAGIETHIETSGRVRRLPIDVETALFRIFQETCTNIIRHAGADFVHVSLSFGSAAAAVDVEDNGSGFDSAQVMKSGAKSRGLGLLGMTERAEFLAGSLTVRSSPGRGTRITAEIPITE